MDNDDFVLVERHGSELEQENDSIPLVTPEDLDKIRLWLFPTEFDSEGSEYRKHLNAHAPHTGDWIFESSQYRTWHDLEIGTVWIQGVPGSGKSVVTANLIEALKKEDVPVLFFFSRRIIKSNSEPKHLVRDCLYQTLDHSVSLQARLKRVSEHYSQVQNVPFHELWGILISAISSFPKVYVLFDALDELAVEKDDFLQCLLELIQKGSNSIRLLMTSRPVPHLQTALKCPSLAIIRLTGRMVEGDVKTYITHRIDNQEEMALTQEDQSAIKDALCEKSQGLFLYARLMLDEILRQSSMATINLHRLPGSLAEMYTDLLHEHSSRSGASMRFQSLLLSWITHASRPLRITELAALINSRDDRGGLNKNQDAKLMIRTSCGSLLEILEDETVQVIHHSFTEFLLDGTRSNNEATTIESEKWFPTLVPDLIHRSLAVSCVEYLLSGCFDSWSIVDQRAVYIEAISEGPKSLFIRFHFLQYASKNMLYHASQCDELGTDLTLLFDRLCQYGGHDFESWKDFLFSAKGEITPENFYPLHLAAQAGLTRYVMRILEMGENPDLIDALGRSPIAYASMHGHAATLAVLLEYKATIDLEDENGLAPIHHAVKGNHVKALTCLLDGGADPMSAISKEDVHCYSTSLSMIGKTPIQLACELGNVDVSYELLERIGPVLRSTVLPHWAATTGQAKVLSLLFRYPEILANINTKNTFGNTALYQAACVGNPASVHILLQHGSDVHLVSDDIDPIEDERSNSSTTRSVRTPLHGWANMRRGRYRNQHLSTVEEWEKCGALLIQAGCDIEAQDEKGQTVLFAWPEQTVWTCRGREDRTERFVSLLLKHGANPSATDNTGNTPLHQNQRIGTASKAIGLLTKAGANINAIRDKDLATPLIVAAKSQCVEVMGFIENGADPNLQDINGDTALHHICSSWLLELSHIQEWLTFADPTIKNKKGETCLYSLRYGNEGDGRVKSIPLFMEKGLDLESKNRLGRTALHSACVNAELQFIYGLIQYGANAKAKDFQNKSCLHIIARPQISNQDNGPKDTETALSLIKTLIKAGATINDVDFEGNSAFHDAVESNSHFVALKIRLEVMRQLGGVANTPDYQGRTTLHKVASLNEDIVTCGDVSRRIDYLLQPSLGLDLHARDNQGLMAIHCAASTSEAHIWKLIQAGADIRAQANDGRTPLHFAAGAAQSNAVGLLCKLYKDKSWTVDQKDETGCTALHYAAYSGNSESVYYLLKYGANSSLKNTKQQTPLHMAAEHQIDTSRLRKQRKSSKQLFWADVPPGLEGLADFMDTRSRIPYDKSPWKLGAIIVHEEEAQMIQDVVGLLIEAGSDPGARDNNGQTAYDAAISLCNEDMANALSGIKPMADISSNLIDQWHSFRQTGVKDIVRSVDLKNTNDYTLLQTAIYLRNENLFKALLELGVDPTAPGPDALTPVHYIAHWGLISMMRILASHIKELNVFSPPLLHVAATRKQSNIQMVKLLIELGVNVSAPYQEFDDERRRSTGAPVPSYAAAHILAMGKQWWNISALNSLCEAGADLEMTDGDGNTVLQCALNGTKCGSWETGFWRDVTSKVLLKHNANINALSPGNGMTPLMAAITSKRDKTLIRRLIDNGADITLGEPPAIFVAIESESIEGTSVVLDAGADVNAEYHPKKPKRYGRGPKVETPLLSAATKDGYMDREKGWTARDAIMSSLLQRGSNPLMKLQQNTTSVLHEIAYYHGRITPILKTGVDLEIRDSQGRTLLILACTPVEYATRFEDDGSTPCELILAGANVHATDNAGATPFQLAIQSGMVKVVKLLLEKGASVSSKNNAGLSPLYYALSYPNFETQLELTKRLLDAGADPLTRGPEGETALHLLAPSLMELSPADGGEARQRDYEKKDKTNYLDECKKLYQHFVDSGCERNGRDDQGNTPLFPYVHRLKMRNDYYRVDPPKEEDVRSMFDDHDVFAVNHNGDTLLHAVAERKDAEGSEPDGVWLFKELVARDVDPRKENKNSLSALDLAAARGRQDILDLFAREE